MKTENSQRNAHKAHWIRQQAIAKKKFIATQFMLPLTYVGVPYNAGKWLRPGTKPKEFI